MKGAIRWLGVLPSAVLGLYLGKWLAHYILDMASRLGAFPLRPVPDGAYQLARALFSPIGFILAGSVTAPRFQGTVGAVLAVAWLLFHFGLMSLYFFMPDTFEPIEGAAELAFIAAVELATLAGCLAAIAMVRDIVDPRPKVAGQDGALQDGGN